MRSESYVWLARALAISLVVHIAVLMQLGQSSQVFDLFLGRAGVRVEAYLTGERGKNEPASVVTSNNRPPSSERGQLENELPKATAAVFGKKSRSTAATTNTPPNRSAAPEIGSLKTLDGAELSAYRLSVARALRRAIRGLPGASGQEVRHELVLELRFANPLSPPSVSILKSSGLGQLDRMYVELVTRAIADLPAPILGQSSPYRVELPVWIEPVE